MGPNGVLDSGFIPVFRSSEAEHELPKGTLSTKKVDRVLGLSVKKDTDLERSGFVPTECGALKTPRRRARGKKSRR